MGLVSDDWVYQGVRNLKSDRFEALGKGNKKAKVFTALIAWIGMEKFRLNGRVNTPDPTLQEPWCRLRGEY